MNPSQALRRLEATRNEFGAGCAAAKLVLLRLLARTRMGSRHGVLRLHEQLCFMRAYPDDREVLAQVRVMLAGFANRSDLRRYRIALDDTGIAGTRIRYRFFWPTARRLAARWPEWLRIDWDSVDEPEKLSAALPLITTPVEATWLRGRNPSPRRALSLLNGGKTGDGTFLVHRVEAMPGDDFTREAFFDALDTPYLLSPGPDTPSRTLAWHARSPVAFVTTPLRRDRPDLYAELKRPPRSVRAASPRQGARLIDLAHAALVTRSRDIDGISFGNARDVWIADDDDGLQWAFIGVVPERRQLLRATYGFVSLRSGVPIGYGQLDTLFRCADISFNSFDTFRGAETAWVFVRLLAASRAMLGARAFTLDAYQVGHHNAEAIASGAWWFYYKLGFRPRDPAVLRLAEAELARMRTNPRHRSTPATLARLATDTLYCETGGVRAPYWPRLAEIGAKAAGRLAALAGADREAAVRECSRMAMRQLGLRDNIQLLWHTQGDYTADAATRKIKGLAVSSAKRLPVLPELPTSSELGHPEIVGYYLGYSVPGGTPRPAIEKLYAAIMHSLEQQEVKDYFAKNQLYVVGMTPEATAKKMAELAGAYADIATQAGIKPQ